MLTKHIIFTTHQYTDDLNSLIRKTSNNRAMQYLHVVFSEHVVASIHQLCSQILKSGMKGVILLEEGKRSDYEKECDENEND